MIKELTYPSSGTVPYINLHSRVSWGAIFGGSFFAIAVFLCLTVLGASIGLVGASNADAGEGLGKQLGIAGGVWSIVAGFISFYCGGWIAGRLNGIGRVSESVIHGLLCWAVTVVVSAFLFTTAVGSIVGGVGGALGTAIAGTGAEIAAGDEGRMSEELREGLDEARRELGLGGGEGAAREGASKAAGAGFGLFAMMLLEAFAAAFGARAGTRILRPVMSEEIGRRERVIA